MLTSPRIGFRIALGLAFGLAAASWPAAVGQETQGDGAIRGRVITADTGTPVRGATVSLTGPSLARWSSPTDLEGRFAFMGLPAGRFRLSATKAGFVTTPYGQDTPSRLSGPIDLAEGQTLDRIEIRLPRGGVISGRVYDELGEPVVEVPVHAMKLEYLQGMRRVRSVRTIETNDLGQYRLYGLQPGTYYVSAAFRTVQLQSNEEERETPRPVPSTGGVAPTFYPGTADGAGAQAVVVKAGEETSNVDFGLLAIPIARVSGNVVDSQGRTATDVVVWLNAARADGALFTAINAAEVDAAGRFALPNVAPGDYRLDVFAKAELETIGQTGRVSGRPQGAGAGEFASVPISVAGHDVDHLVITTTPGYRLSGRLIIEGVEPTQRQLGAMTVRLLAPMSSVSAVMLSANAPVEPDGTFEVRGLVGHRLVRVWGLPPEWALVSVTVPGADVTDEGLEIRADVIGAEIVVTATPPRLSGVVVDSRGASVPDTTVIVFSEDEGGWRLPMTRYVATARPDALGRFSITSLPAGAYHASVVFGTAPDDWAGHDFLGALRETATHIRLAAAKEETVALEVRR